LRLHFRNKFERMQNGVFEVCPPSSTHTHTHTELSLGRSKAVGKILYLWSPNGSSNEVEEEMGGNVRSFIQLQTALLSRSTVLDRSDTETRIKTVTVVWTYVRVCLCC
jgi:hypothetical protein